MSFVDRLLTIVVTATVTSAAWLVMGGTVLNRDAGGEGRSASSSISAATGEKTLASPARRIDRDDLLSPPIPAAGEIVIPVAGVSASQLTDTFTQSRENGARLHEAIDIMAPRGTPVVAAAPGTIEKLFVSAAGGNTIYVRSRDGRTIHYYAHLDEYAAGLAEGQTVAQGAALGTVGISGNAAPDAPHLHFAILRTQPEAKWWEPAVAINPYPLLTAR